MILDDLVENEAIDLLATVLVAAGAINWGTREFFDTQLLEGTLSLAPGSTEYQVVIAAIALAGVLKLYSGLYWNTEAVGDM